MRDAPDRRQSQLAPLQMVSGAIVPEIIGVIFQSARHILDEYAIERVRLGDPDAYGTYDRVHAKTALEAIDAIRLVIEARLAAANARDG